MERDELIALVRKESGIRLREEDPVLAVVAINDVLLSAALAKIDATLLAAADRQTAATAMQAAASRQHVEDAKKVAAALVNSSGAWVTEQLKEAGAEVTATMLADLRKETAKVQAVSRVATRMAWVAGGAAALTAAGLAGFLIAAL